jgi:hypothetical protein
MLLPHALLLGAIGGRECGTLRRAEQARDDIDGTGCIEHVDDRLCVFRRDLYRRMGLARGRAANQQRQVHAESRHLACHEHHLVQRRRNQPAQPIMSAFSSIAV